MTLVRAHKIDDEIIIVSDTKLTYAVSNEDYHTQDNLGTGTVKSIILSDSICFSFSGDISYAIEALKEIGKSKDILYIIDILHSINKKACLNGNDSEFILAYIDNGSYIIEFKNSEYEEVSCSWIGSRDGFYAYQETFGSKPNQSLNVNLDDVMTKKVGGYSFNQNQLAESVFQQLEQTQHDLVQEPNLAISFQFSIQKIPDGYSEKQITHFNKMTHSIINVIDNISVPGVGGFHVIVASQNNTFSYMPRAAHLKTPINYNELTHIIDYKNNQNETQFINFFTHSNDALALHITKSKTGILYYKDSNSFMRPEIFYPYDEIDFSYEVYSKYGIDGAFGIESNYNLFEHKAKNCYITNPQKALDYMLKGVKLLEKAIRNDLGNTSQHEPLEYYCINEYNKKAYLSQYYENIGVTYYYAQDLQNAKHYIESAILVNPLNHNAYNSLAIISNDIKLSMKT